MPQAIRAHRQSPLVPTLARFGLLVLASSFIAACGAPDDVEPEVIRPGAWATDEAEAPDVVDIALVEEAVVTEQALVEMVVVQPDRLVFPASEFDAVVANFPAGAPVVGDRSVDPAGGNPLGFLRKVREVRVDGDEVIVETEPALLTDIMTGSVQVSIDPDAAEELDIGDLNPTPSFHHQTTASSKASPSLTPTSPRRPRP